MERLNILIIITVLFNSLISCNEVVELDDINTNHEVYELRDIILTKVNLMIFSHDLKIILLNYLKSMDLQMLDIGRQLKEILYHLLINLFCKMMEIKH